MRKETKKIVENKIGSFELDTVHQLDCIDGMKKLPAESFDLAIADPPYNLSKGGNWEWDNSVDLPGFGGSWSKVMEDWDDLSTIDYLKFSISWLTEVNRLVKPTGSLWIHGTYHNIGIINFALQYLGIEIINEIIWFKRNSFPNLSGRRLTASHETIIWAHTGGAKSREYLINYEEIKEKDYPEDNIKSSGKQMRTVWDIPNNKAREELRFGKHPTQKPLRLLNRIFDVSAKPNSLVLVPFAGAGSECVAAIANGHTCIGFELDPKYVEISNMRIGNTKETMNSRKQYKLFDVSSISNSNSNFHQPRQSKNIPSLIKWTGSKRSQARDISTFIPPYLTYLEPFLGGGALLYLTAHPGAIAGDSYKPLIELWKRIASEPDMVVDDYEGKWIKLNNELDTLDINHNSKGERVPKTFYAIRDQFNETHDPLDLNFLMRTCVNGIARFNKSGEFNNSFHLSRRGMDPNRFRNVVRKWYPLLQGVNFICADYSETMGMAAKDDFVYLDPPYAGTKQRYYDGIDIDSFFVKLEELNSKGVNWALSFDGKRGKKEFVFDIPKSIYKRHIFLSSGKSAVKKVLSGEVENVEESLYLNF